MSVEIPPLPDTCGWPVDWACYPDSDSLDPVVKQRAEAMAVQSLRFLTLYQVGGCPITVRPCAQSCLAGVTFYDGRPWMSPHVGVTGQWVNACGCASDCSCGPLSEVILDAPVGRVDEVQVDGEVLDPSTYRVDNGNRLVRQDGGLWPICQDQSQPAGGPGTFTVTYLNGIPVDGYASYVAGLLAAEFAVACGGGQCALPPSVTAVVRQGVTMEFAVGAWPDMRTGILGVDTWLSIFNPASRMSTPVLSSPDVRRARRTTWASS